MDLKEYLQLDPKSMNIRKKLSLYKKDQELLLHITQKSRVLQKDVEGFEDILSKVEENQNIKFKDKVIMIEAPLCSKAKAKLETLAWKVLHVKDKQ